MKGVNLTYLLSNQVYLKVSVLGPLLFLIYVNDIPALCSFSSVFLFADDAKLIASLNSASENLALQKDLDNLLSWCQS